MSTKLFIPYSVKLGKGSQFLLVYANQKRKILALSLSARLLLKGLSDKEYLILLRLSETLEFRSKGIIYYLLALRGLIPQKTNGLIKNLRPEFLSHIELEKMGNSLKGDPKSQLSRLEGQLKLSLKIVNEKKVKPKQLRWMGIGYRDKGSLSTYSFNWKDLSGNLQVNYSLLFAREDNTILKNAILKAEQDLKIFYVGQPLPNEKKVPDEIPRPETKHNNFFQDEDQYLLKNKEENWREAIRESKSFSDIAATFAVVFPNLIPDIKNLITEKLSPLVIENLNQEILKENSKNQGSK